MLDLEHWIHINILTILFLLFQCALRATLAPPAGRYVTAGHMAVTRSQESVRVPRARMGNNVYRVSLI